MAVLCRIHTLQRSDPRWQRAGLWVTTKAARKK
jgi:hypothetical protein